MLTADERRALATWLRDGADPSDAPSRADLLAAADELERARPQVQWADQGDGTVVPYVTGERGPMPLYAKPIDTDDAEHEFVPAYLSAGFDVAPLPRRPMTTADLSRRAGVALRWTEAGFDVAGVPA